jgi:hypothetical protein
LNNAQLVFHKEKKEMAKLENYNGTVDVLAGLRAKGKSDFPLVTAHDVQTREDGTRLDAELEMLRSGGATIYAGTVTTTDTGGNNKRGNLGVALSLTQGAAYKVTFNGIDYNCVGSKEDIYPYLGNAHFLIDSGEDTGEPFCLMFATHATYLITNEAGSYTLAIYEATGGGIAITEVSSPEEITADKPDGFYVVPGGGSGGESGGGSGTPIHYYDSLEAVPADLPDGSFVAVPSSGGGGGLPVVELETILSNGATLSESDTTKMAQLNGDLFIAKCNISNGEGGGIPMTLMFSSALAIEGIFLYSAISNSTVLENICIGNLEGVWGVNIVELYTR